MFNCDNSFPNNLMNMAFFFSSLISGLFSIILNSLLFSTSEAINLNVINGFFKLIPFKLQGRRALWRKGRLCVI